MKEAPQSGWRQTPPLLALALLFGAVHLGTLGGSWRFDDPYILLFAQGLPNLHAAFVSPAVWQSFGIPFFTPMQTLAFQLDGLLFQHNAALFYLHHLAVLLGITLLTCLLVQRHFGRLAGFAAGLLFLLGAPTHIVSQQLMSRQYAEGLLYALLSLLCWLRWVRAQGQGARIASALFYLLAMLCKEIYAPLPLVLLALSAGTWPQRLLRMGPHAAVAAVYIVWRSWMLGTVVGGYFNHFSEYAQIGNSWFNLLGSFWGQGAYRLACLLMLLACLACVLRRYGRKGLGLVAAAALMLSLPFIAIQASAEPLQMRLAFLPWWACCVLLAVALAQYRVWISGSLALVLTLAMAALTAHAGLITRQAYSAMTDSYDVQSRFLASHDQSVGYVPSGLAAVDLFFQYGMAGLRQPAANGSPVNLPFAQAASALPVPTGVHAFDAACRCMRQLPPLAAKPPLEPAQAITASIERPMNQPGMQWQLATALPSSHWYLYFPKLNASLLITDKGRVGFALPPWVDTPVRVMLLTDSGAWAMTPEMRFPALGQRLQYPAP